MANERDLGLLGKKLGMTQIYDPDGRRYGVTVVQVGPCIVLSKKDQAKDGYSALQLGFQDIKDKHATKSEQGHAKKANTPSKRWIREFRVSAEVAGKYEVGATISAADVLTEGSFLDISAKSKGKGYQGVMKRHHFKGFRATHGSHEFFRHGGSIGNREFPGRVFKNRKMAGQMGNKFVTQQNVKIVRVMGDKNLVLVHGAVPGGTEQLVVLRTAIKKQSKKKAK